MGQGLAKSQGEQFWACPLNSLKNIILMPNWLNDIHHNIFVETQRVEFVVLNINFKYNVRT